MPTFKQKEKIASIPSSIFYQYYDSSQTDLACLYLAYTSGNPVSTVGMEYLFEYHQPASSSL